MPTKRTCASSSGRQLLNSMHWRNLSLCSSFSLRFNRLGLQTELIETQRKGGAEEQSMDISVAALGEGLLQSGYGEIVD